VCKKKHSEKLKVLRRNKLRRGSGWKFFSREEPTENFPTNEQDPFRGIRIFPDREIWESCMEDSLRVLRHSVYSEVWKCSRSGIIEVPKKAKEIWTVGSGKDTWQICVLQKKSASEERESGGTKTPEAELPESIVVVDLRRTCIIRSWDPKVCTLEKRGEIEEQIHEGHKSEGRSQQESLINGGTHGEWIFTLED
jgi:hypothetical protein